MLDNRNCYKYLRPFLPFLSLNSDFFNSLGQQGPSGNYSAENGLGYPEKYRFGEQAFRDISFYNGDSTPHTNDCPGNWTVKKRVDNTAKFLNDPSAPQDAAAQMHASTLRNSIQHYGPDQYIGDVINEIHNSIGINRGGVVSWYR